MKIITSFFLFVLVAMPALAIEKKAGPTSILVAPKAPKFTDAERHAELARRRANSA